MKNRKLSVAINTSDDHVKRHRKLYIIGACACLLADELSDFEALPLLKPLKAINNDLRSLSTVTATIPAMKVLDGCERFTKRLERGTGMTTGKASKEAVEQFAQSADLLHNVLDAMHKVPTKHHASLDKEIEALVKKYASMS